MTIKKEDQTLLPSTNTDFVDGKFVAELDWTSPKMVALQYQKIKNNKNQSKFTREKKCQNFPVIYSKLVKTLQNGFLNGLLEIYGIFYWLNRKKPLQNDI